MIKKSIAKHIYIQFKTALLLLLFFSVVTGLIYPILVTGLAQIFFSTQANGSLLLKDKKIVGSEFIGQFFVDPKYFWGRPSATTPFPYNALASSGSNLGITNPTWLKMVRIRIESLRKIDPQNNILIPIELITASGSGLDPHITPAAAFYQIKRISKARRITEDDVRNLLIHFIENRQFGFLGEPRVNVLKLNLALDMLSEKKSN